MDGLVKNNAVEMKLCTELQPHDVAFIREKLDGFLPEKIFDFHAHLLNPNHFPPGKYPTAFDPKAVCGLEEYFAATAQRFPDRKVEGLFFGFPHKAVDRAATNEWILSEIASQVKSGKSRALALVSPKDDPALLRKEMALGKYLGIKPYHVYADQSDTMQAAVEEYAPEWMWELCHQFNGILMLHLVRSRGIADPQNIASLQKLCRKYPDCRVILAHIARSFCYRHAQEGLSSVADLENVFVDTSVITEAEAFRQAFRVLGPERVLYGSDFPVSEWRGKCMTMGDGFSWVYADQLPSPAVAPIGEFTLIGIESLLCLHEACVEARLDETAIRAIFHDNAMNLLSAHLNKPPQVVNLLTGEPV